MKKYIAILSTILLISCEEKEKIGFNCTGSEPFWMIIYENEQFTFNSMDGGESINLGYVEPITTENPKKYEYNFPQAKLIVEYKEESCEWDMSGEGNIKYVSEFTFNAIPYKGCATPVEQKTE